MEIILIIACIICLSIAAKKRAMRGGVRPAAPPPPKMNEYIDYNKPTRPKPPEE